MTCRNKSLITYWRDTTSSHEKYGKNDYMWQIIVLNTYLYAYRSRKGISDWREHDKLVLSFGLYNMPSIMWGTGNSRRQSSYSQEAQNLLNQGRHHMSGERHCLGQKNRALWEGSKHFRCGELCLPEALAWLEGRGYWRVVGGRAG